MINSERAASRVASMERVCTSACGIMPLCHLLEVNVYVAIAVGVSASVHCTENGGVRYLGVNRKHQADIHILISSNSNTMKIKSLHVD